MVLDSEQNSGLQTIVLDRVHGAGRPGTVLIGGAGVIDIFPALAPGHGLATISASQKTAEQVELPATGGCPGIAEQEGLHLVKGFLGDNRLMGIEDAHPFILRHSLDLVYLVAFYPAPRVRPGLPAMQLWRRKNFLSYTTRKAEQMEGRSGIFLQIFFHAFQAAQNGLADGALIHALGLGNLLVGHAEDKVSVHPPALDLRQVVQCVPQTAEPLLELQNLVRGLGFF